MLLDDRRHARADARLFAIAAKQRWPIPARTKRRAVETLAEILDDPAASRRTRLAAVRAVVAMESVNAGDERAASQSRALSAALIDPPSIFAIVPDSRG